MTNYETLSLCCNSIIGEDFSLMMLYKIHITNIKKICITMIVPCYKLTTILIYNEENNVVCYCEPVSDYDESDFHCILGPADKLILDADICVYQRRVQLMSPLKISSWQRDMQFVFQN